MAFTRKFYTSDTHFGHQGMLVFGGRKFKDTSEMDELLIKRWNEVVGSSDIVYHLGDFAFQLDNAERVNGIFHRLNGRKFLVIGNHDVRKDGTLHPTIAALAWEDQPQQMMEVKDEGNRVILCHYSLRVWPASHRGSYHFYGHSHGNLPPHGLSRDVGVDVADTNFQPRDFKQLVRGLKP